MNRFLSFFLCLLLIRSVCGSESMLTTTWQPLDGLGSGAIKIVEVTCHDWYAMSGMPTAIGLISARNRPPTNNPKAARGDLNLASVCGLLFSADDMEVSLELNLDATKFSIPERIGHPKEHILRASLECLRRCLPEKLRRTPVTLKVTDADKEWMEKIVAEFNAHDRTRVFFVPPS